MRIARRQSYRSTSRRPWERVRRKNPCPHRILALRRKKRRKKRRKSGENRGGEITPMRLRRSLFFVKPATLAGRPSRRKPGETVQGPPRPTRPDRLRSVPRPQAAQGCRARSAFVLSQRMARLCPAPQSRQIKCANHGLSQPQTFRRKPQPRRAPRDTNHGLYGRSVRRECERVAPPKTAARTAAPADKSLLHCTRSRGIARQSCCPVTASLLTSAHYCPELLGGGGGPLSKCPRTVRRSRSASRRAPFAAQFPSPCGLLGLRPRPNVPMLRKGSVLLCATRGTFYIALTAAGFDLSRRFADFVMFYRLALPDLIHQKAGCR